MIIHLITFGKSIVVNNNRIESIVESTEEFESSDANFVDVGGKAIVPGFIDAHNHLIWSGDRFNEHNLRMKGHSYADIAGMGGGIMQTVSSTRRSSDEELLNIGKTRLLEALRNGTTFVEAKSGYGLSTEHELRLLKIVDQLKSEKIYHPFTQRGWALMLSRQIIPMSLTQRKFCPINYLRYWILIWPNPQMYFANRDGFQSNSLKTYSVPHVEAVSICGCTSTNSVMEEAENLLPN